MTEELSCINHNGFVENLNILNKTFTDSDHITFDGQNSDSEVEEMLFKKTKSKSNRLTQSDSDTDKENDFKQVPASSPQKTDSDSNNAEEVIIKIKKKSRIRAISNSDSESLPGIDNTEANKYDLSRTKIRNKKLQNKFKKLKQPKSTAPVDDAVLSSAESDGGVSDNSSDAEISCSKIKLKLQKKSSHSLTAICDPDTSDDESNAKDVKIQKSKPRSIKLTSPKPARMSAKQAMENMQKIKSESNRMLREKEVSLPYHRPKALTLKDIMNRRKPALTSDGKSLPIKMNNEQLRQYALMLEQRQKEMMELCKSDSDEEEQDDDNGQLSDNKIEDTAESNDKETTLNEENCNSDANDKTFDDITLKHNIADSISDNNLNEGNIQKAVDVTETVEENYCHISENDTKEIANKTEEAMDTSISHEDHASPLNSSNKDTITIEEDQTNKGANEKEKEIMKVFPENNKPEKNNLNKDNEQESQLISLHFDSEKTEVTNSEDMICDLEKRENIEESKDLEITTDEPKKNLSDEFSDDDFTMDELEEIIENAEVNKGTTYKPLPSIEATLDIKPMLMGTPGMVIDLDDSNESTENTQRKLTGVEILKERYKYFAKIKSLEEMEKDREKKFKPGIQHLKLKQKLEEEIAEQRSLEWEKRLQVENQLKSEMNTVEDEFDGEDIEKIEAKLDENDVIEEEESSSEEEIEEEDCVIKDKPRERNPLLDDEAEVSEDEDNVGDDDDKEEADDNDDENKDDENDSEDDDEESSESEEEEQQTNCRKGRILKAFEDSDDEEIKTGAPDIVVASQSKNQEIHESQDDEIHLAQPQKTFSDDVFSSQECNQISSKKTDETNIANTSLEDLGSQTFSIMKSATEKIEEKNVSLEKIDVICETQPCEENFEAIVGMCTGGFAQNLVTPEAESSQLSQSQELGDDVAELCTGKFYDNPFLSQTEGEIEDKVDDKTDDDSMIDTNTENETDVIPEVNNPKQTDDVITEVNNPKPTNEGDNKLLNSILDELNDPEFDAPKPNKYFFNATKNESKDNVESTQFKKKFVIESDDDMNDDAEGTNKKKKRKKRKLENRALQISDDEEEYSEAELETYESEIDEDNERLVEYDSEENEVEIKTKYPKKKRVGREFLEQEAELTSEDEWRGSGDEDEAGLDRMEREAGDDDSFHQGRLQRQLGEIHMREVLDQDKREVRLLQELLFEDGDLGDGHRQRKFRWKNANGEEELGTNAEEYADTQEDEFESEEQWRKQRHEREMFLRKLQEKDEDANVSINRSAFIKATLASKPSNATEKITSSEKSPSMENKPQEANEKKKVNSIPSPKKPFILLQQNYHNSLLTRGRGSLARLAALATPLAGDGDDGPRVNASSRGNFVFAALTDSGSKVTKRKAETAPDTPRLLKKMKQDSNKCTKNSLLDHLSF